MDPFPDDVRIFLAENVDSIDQLEILRILGEDRDRAWTAPALAPHVQATLSAVSAHLAALHGRGLLARLDSENEARWRHGPRTPELVAAVDRFLELYRQRPVTTINLVSSRARAALKAFSDAFRLRKEH